MYHFFVKRAQLSLRNASLASSLSHVAPHHFKMEGLHALKDLLQTGDWMTKVDLRDAYFMIPIHSSDRSLQTRIVINSRHAYHSACPVLPGSLLRP